MLPGVSTRVLVLNEPIPPTMVPYTGPPLASAPWHTAHLASYTALPSATVPLPAGRPLPSVVRTSISHGAISAAAIGRPNLTPGLGTDCDASYCCDAQPYTSSAAGAATSTDLSDRIFHLAARAHRPRENAVMVLHEAHDRAGFGNILDGRLDVARTV